MTAAGTCHFLQERDVVREIDGEAWQLAVVHGLRLRSEHALGLFLGDAAWNEIVGGGDVLRDVGHHFDAAVKS